MKFMGINKVSMVDYPKKIVSTLFTGGCNFRCAYCHNPDLIKINRDELLISEEEAITHLKSRKKLIDGVCVTGGEPSLWGDELVNFFRKVKSEVGEDFLTKVDTNGSNPEFIEKINGVVDFVAMDFKGADYSLFSEIEKSIIDRSYALIKLHKNYEIRVTMYPDYIKKEDFEKIGEHLKGMKRVAIQQFNPKVVYNEKAKEIKVYSEDVLKEFKEILERYVEVVEIRGI